MNQFIGTLDVRLLQDDKSGLWELLAPFGYASESSGVRLTVPAGFKTDFCSVPRLPLIYELLGNTARRAGVIHDYIYQTRLLTRLAGDRLLREMITVCGLTQAEAHQFYLAVRIGGSSHYGRTI